MPQPRGVPEPPTLTVIIPVLNEEENLPEVVRRVHEALGALAIDYEILFVNDGSTDGSQAFLEDRAARDPRVRAIALSRNFGHQVAVSAGLDHARGRAVAILDADLQDPPEVLGRFLEKWRAGYEVVYGVRRKRKENLLKRCAYTLYYRLLASSANVAIPLDSGDFCLMDRRVVDLINQLPERGRFVRGLRAWVGLRQIGVEYERAARHAGAPKYTLGKLFSLATGGIVGFSLKPLQLATKLGFTMALFALGLVGVYLLRWVFTGTEWPRGFASLFIGLFLLFGIQFILIGILGEYIGSIHTEVKGRPLYLVDKVVGFATPDPGHDRPASAGPAASEASESEASDTVQPGSPSRRRTLQ